MVQPLLLTADNAAWWCWEGISTGVMTSSVKMRPSKKWTRPEFETLQRLVSEAGQVVSWVALAKSLP